jgi:hypothetical protein
MNTCWAASLALVAPLAVPLFAAARGDSRERFVALQLMSSVATLVLIMLSFATASHVLASALAFAVS